jgi:hypothetical protein
MTYKADKGSKPKGWGIRKTQENDTSVISEALVKTRKLGLKARFSKYSKERIKNSIMGSTRG